MNSTKTRLVEPKILIPFILLTSCFAWWGLANNMTDTLLSAFKKIKSMSDFQTSMIQMAFYGAYFCFALPAALFIRKYSYKSGVLLGLALFIIGGLLFYPSSKTMEYWHFLLSLYILASGLSILETSANPYMLKMGDPASATRRLNFAQSFNPVGAITGVLLGKFVILSGLQTYTKEERLQMTPEDLKSVQMQELDAVMIPYVLVAFILIAVWIGIAFSKMPKYHDEGNSSVTASFSRLVKNKTYVFGVIAQFFNIGAQIGVWSYSIRYVQKALDLNEADASTYYLISIILFGISRFICTALMKYIRPSKLLLTLALVAVILTGMVIFSDGMTGVIALILISACLSLMFPTIYGLSLENVGDDAKIGGAGLIMAILGGAILTSVQGMVSDNWGINMSYVVPFVCFAVIALFALNKINTLKKL